VDGTASGCGISGVGTSSSVTAVLVYRNMSRINTLVILRLIIKHSLKGKCCCPPLLSCGSSRFTHCNRVLIVRLLLPAANQIIISAPLIGLAV